MYKNSFVHYLTKILVDIMLVGGLLCCVALPFVVPRFADFLNIDESVIIPVVIALFLAGQCALYILWQLRAIFKTLLGGDPFVSANVTCLRKCSVASFLIALIFTISIPFRVTVASVIIVVVFAVLGLFCLTLKDVFKQAIAYKEENEWTV
jgi:hypothetical protein